MALHVPKAPGFASMLKEGSSHFSGLEEAVTRNISACKQFADTLRTCYGPCGMNKMVVNHIEKLFVTNDAGTIINELDVEHPAAKILVLASDIQDKEVGDGTNFVILFAAALLQGADELLTMGLSPSEIGSGYEMAYDKAAEILPSLVLHEIKDVRQEENVVDVIRTSIMSKLLGCDEIIAKLVTKACISIIGDKQTSFNVDNVRVCKILGSSLSRSEVVQGLVFKRNVETAVIKKSNAKVAVYTCPIDIMQTETKGTVLINTAKELMDFSEGEEALLEKQIKAIADSGASVVVTGGKIGDMALHFLNKYNLMAIRLLSKFDLRRVCKAVNACAAVKMDPPKTDELGYADEVYVDEIGDSSVVVIRVGKSESRLSTIVLRGATDNFLDDVERSVSDGINVFRALTKDGRVLAGGGAVELELSRQISEYASTLPGLEQYSVKKFASALEGFVKIFAENSGRKPNEVLARLNAAHHEGKTTMGFDVSENSTDSMCDTKERKILDTYLGKYWGLDYGTHAAVTILRIDQIIMAKKAGGPKPRDARGGDPDDD